jgi:hypothetical protein
LSTKGRKLTVLCCPRSRIVFAPASQHHFFDDAVRAVSCNAVPECGKLAGVGHTIPTPLHGPRDTHLLVSAATAFASSALATPSPFGRETRKLLQLFHATLV